MRVCLYFCPFALVFAFLFVLSFFSLSFFALVVFLCPLALSFWLFGSGCCFLFPYGLYAKERAQGFALVSSLFVCYVCLDACIVIKKFRCCCFGFFQFVRLVLPCNTASIRRLARSNFDFLRHYVDITYNRPAFLK